MTRILSAEELSALSGEDLEVLYAEVHRRRGPVQENPKLAAGVSRAVAVAESAGRLSAQEAAQVRSELARYHPGSVLAGWWRKLLPDRPALGAFRTAFPRSADIGELYRRDPERALSAYMAEVARFAGHDEDKVLETAAAFAQRVGIPDQVAEDALVAGLRRLRTAWRQKEAV